MGEDKQAVFSLFFVYHGAERQVTNATLKRAESFDWFIVGLETWKDGTETGVIKSYKFEDCENVQMVDVYEYEGAQNG